MVSERPISNSIVVESIPSAITNVCRLILSKLDDYGFSKEDTFAVHLALEEAFSNAITHGNKMDPTKKITINYSVDPDKVEIFVQDQGGGFEPEAVPDPRFGKKLYEPDGRGLLLMQAYMDIVEFNEQGNTVHMVRYKEKPPFTGR
jgi:serine/threonine-protein kinase RsbW